MSSEAQLPISFDREDIKMFSREIQASDVYDALDSIRVFF